MNIFFITSSMNMGGAERVAATLCNAWGELGNQVTLVPTFSQASQSFYELSPQVELIYLNDRVKQEKKTFLSYSKRLLSLRRLIQEKKPDVIISFLSNVNVATILASRFLKIPVICCERRNPQNTIGPIWEWLCKKTYPYADVLLVQTQAVIPPTQQKHPRAKHIHSIANPVANEIINIQKTWEERPRKTLLSLSRLVRGKQIDKIILAFNKLAHAHPDWDLHIYGEGPMQQELTQMIEALNLQNRVFLKGAINNPWATLAKEADIFVMCSQHEGFPNSLLEAMGVGIPCVSFDFPYGAREMSDNGRNALLVPLNDTQQLEHDLQQLMNDESLRKRLSTQAREHISNQYNIDTILADWHALFRTLGIKGT